MVSIELREVNCVKKLGKASDFLGIRIIYKCRLIKYHLNLILIDIFNKPFKFYLPNSKKENYEITFGS